MRLIDLYSAQEQEALSIQGNGELVIAGMTMDSRQIKPGYLFLAVPGEAHDGRDYIEQSIEKGAVAILTLPKTTLPEVSEGVALIEDMNPRRRFALMASAFYGDQPETIYAVTGTNGKTSVAYFIQQLVSLLGEKSASIGTLGVHGVQLDAEKIPSASGGLTTNDSIVLHQQLSSLKEQEVKVVALEASSHGLDQYRLDGVQLSAAGFTNLTRDHLDYHGSMDKYFQAKARLFAEILPKGHTAVINADDPYGQQLIKQCQAKGHHVISYGKTGEDLVLLDQKAEVFGQTLDVKVFGQHFKVDVPIFGLFQAHNLLCALGMILSDSYREKEAIEQSVHALEKLQGVRGRMESVSGHPKQALIFVDYAHTPDALENALKAVRPHTKNKLHVVFGCGGDRDTGKRPMMGEIATRLADHVIVTDDNPRTEDADKIREEIMVATQGAMNIGDRRLAIQKAVADLKDGDVLLVAGKGHEQGQKIGDALHPFDDVTEVKNAIERL